MVFRKCDPIFPFYVSPKSLLLLQLPGLFLLNSHPGLQDLCCTLLSKGLDSLVVQVRSDFTGALVFLSGTLVVHIALEVVVDASLARVCEAVLLLVVAVAKVVAVAGVGDFILIHQLQGDKLKRQGEALRTVKAKWVVG